MSIQQLVAFAIVGVAAVYLGRSFVGACRAFFSGKGGCASGCGKCAFAPREGGSSRQAASVRRPDIIPLADVRSLPRKRDSD